MGSWAIRGIGRVQRISGRNGVSLGASSTAVYDSPLVVDVEIAGVCEVYEDLYRLRVHSSQFYIAQQLGVRQEQQTEILTGRR